jgi:hypothetical protein
VEVLLGSVLRAVQRHGMVSAGVEHGHQHELADASLAGGPHQVGIALGVDRRRAGASPAEEAMHGRDHSRAAVHGARQGGGVAHVAGRHPRIEPGGACGGAGEDAHLLT